MTRSAFAVKAAPFVFVIAFIAIWEGAVRLLSIQPFLLPAPSRIAGAFVQYGPAIWRESLYTLVNTLIGFAIAVVFGLALGLLIGWSRLVYAGVYPLLIGFNAIPKVALVPILAIWCGVGSLPAILTAFLISFFPIVVNVATGLATIEPEMEDVLKALGASKFDIMRKVGLPRALPYFFGSLKVAITLAFVGSVIAEGNASNNGIGKLMLLAQSQSITPLVFAGLIVLAVEGIAMYAIMAAIESRTTRWARRSGFAP